MAQPRPIAMAEVALREEKRVARVLARIADEARPFAGGMMARGTPGGWFNRAQGIGFDGPVDSSEVARLIDFFREKGIEPRAEVCPFAHPSLIEAFARAGFVVRRFQTVLYRTISPGDDFTPPHALAPGIHVEAVDASDEAALEEFARAWATGFEVTGSQRVEEAMRAARHVAVAPGSIGVRAVFEGRCVGAGGVELDGDLGALFGASVVPDMRCRGIQLAMFAWRLRAAADRGATLATIQSAPGASTERNASRMGFTTAYSKVVLVRPGEGLTAVVGG